MRLVIPRSTYVILESVVPSNETVMCVTLAINDNRQIVNFSFFEFLNAFWSHKTVMIVDISRKTVKRGLCNQDVLKCLKSQLDFIVNCITVLKKCVSGNYRLFQRVSEGFRGSQGIFERF